MTRLVSDRERTILEALKTEYRADGHQLVTHEGETYARITARQESGAVILTDINLDALAAQIERRLK